ncbi:dethiobiotin synthase [Buchnera aphidicola]|uniref:dethiobiotin synthase n=1 Tax=Buchnera aphidicola TaxID=9 RepID=UPI00346438B2
MIKKWFLTGTDTNVGKTIVSGIILKKASNIGFNTAGYKPIASGCIKQMKHFKNYDAVYLKKNSTVQLTYEKINPFFVNNNFPPNFFFDNDQKISLKKISHHLQYIEKLSNWIIIEGVGGWYTPIYKKIKLSDWVKKENLPVIIVVAIKLGCINHAILTYKAIIQCGLKCSGWYANFMKNTKNSLKYINTIKRYMNIPFLGIIPHIHNIHNFSVENINIILPK